MKTTLNTRLDCPRHIPAMRAAWSQVEKAAPYRWLLSLDAVRTAVESRREWLCGAGETVGYTHLDPHGVVWVEVDSQGYRQRLVAAGTLQSLLAEGLHAKKLAAWTAWRRWVANSCTGSECLRNRDTVYSCWASTYPADYRDRREDRRRAARDGCFPLSAERLIPVGDFED